MTITIRNSYMVTFTIPRHAPQKEVYGDWRMAKSRVAQLKWLLTVDYSKIEMTVIRLGSRDARWETHTRVGMTWFRSFAQFMEQGRYDYAHITDGCGCGMTYGHHGDNQAAICRRLGLWE